MKAKSYYISIGVIFLILVLSSCAPAGHTRNEHGFFSGIVHGFVLIFALIGKLFGGDHGLYAEHNSGFFYWLGFLIGLGVIGGGGAASRR